MRIVPSRAVGCGRGRAGCGRSKGDEMQLSGNPSVSRIGRLRWALVIVAFIGCQAPPALADHVVLKVGAGNAVPVRERPSGDSDKVGELGPGDRAEFLGSVPHWFEIRLAEDR